MSDAPIIYLRPLNGLCNRMRAIASGRALAVATGARLVVLWDSNSDVGARYGDLFITSDHDGFELAHLARGASVNEIVKFILFGESLPLNGIPVAWITRLLLSGRIQRNVRPDTFQPTELEELVKRSGRSLLTSWWSFYGKNNLDFSFFRPRADEQAEIDKISVSFNEKTIGVHIRRSDNVNSIRYSPTSAFVSAMIKALEDNSETRFYLATDCLETEAEIVDMFGKYVITRKRHFNRSTIEGMRDAIVDLFLLSKTSRIIGSYYSTFSETAASIGRINWVTVTHDASLQCNSELLVVPKQS